MYEHHKYSKKVKSNGYVYFCPRCDSTVWQIKLESKYCFRCGQKLDWEGVKHGCSEKEALGDVE